MCGGEGVTGEEGERGGRGVSARGCDGDVCENSVCTRAHAVSSGYDELCRGGPGTLAKCLQVKHPPPRHEMMHSPPVMAYLLNRTQDAPRGPPPPLLREDAPVLGQSDLLGPPNRGRRSRCVHGHRRQRR